jgi:serine/threonine-protein kinase HipA
MANRSIYVYADWKEVKGPRLMGILTAEIVRGKEVFSFEYDKEWLQSGFSQDLDPDLHMFSGPQYLNDQSKSNFGLFLDSSPDRWGRVLMQRREAALARLEERSAKKLLESDYLLGVYDAHRMGGIRFKTNLNGPFLNNDEKFASPPWTSIRQLEQISLKLEEENIADDPDYINWLYMLVTPGSSLGGARPKASVIDTNGHLWIAKFPSKNDDNDVGGWEMVAYQLALAAGIQMAESQARKFSSHHHTFLTKRFDRNPNFNRIHFTSAMTQLGYTDGTDAAAGVSYLELVEFITSHGSEVNRDLAELWRRIVFNICVSNVDDHLRNHGFLFTTQGWILSPAYDVNPVETGMGLKLNITEEDNSLNLDLAMEVHEYFRLTGQKAETILQEVKAAVRQWRKVATEYGISKNSQEIKAPAFSIVE